MARRRRYQFTEKKQSRLGICASLLALALLVLFVLLLALAFVHSGTLSVYFGTVGLFALVFAVVDFLMAVHSMREEKSFKLFPRCATMGSILAILCWGGIYFLGFIL